MVTVNRSFQINSATGLRSCANGRLRAAITGMEISMAVARLCPGIGLDPTVPSMTVPARTVLPITL